MAIATFKVQLDDNIDCNLLFLFVLGLKEDPVREVSVRDPYIGPLCLCMWLLCCLPVGKLPDLGFLSGWFYVRKGPLGDRTSTASLSFPFLSPWFGNMKRSELLKCLGVFRYKQSIWKEYTNLASWDCGGLPRVVPNSRASPPLTAASSSCVEIFLTPYPALEAMETPPRANPHTSCFSSYQFLHLWSTSIDSFRERAMSPGRRYHTMTQITGTMT